MAFLFLSVVYETEVKIHLVFPANKDHVSLAADNHSYIDQRVCFAACLKNNALE